MCVGEGVHIHNEESIILIAICVYVCIISLIQNNTGYEKEGKKFKCMCVCVYEVCVV